MVRWGWYGLTRALILEQPLEEKQPTFCKAGGMFENLVKSRKIVYIYIYNTIWLFNIAMENPPIFQFGKPSISMGHGLTMAMLNSQVSWFDPEEAANICKTAFYEYMT